ncbi:hypothetical protein ACH414_30110 [Streptomyces sp. NPDC020422]|uniref:hypothetical protein n=1 Tax=Streptomyces sp. NPDC020422 TaxID=3365074 RepID=UPI0037884B51
MRVRYLGPPAQAPDPLDGRYVFEAGREYVVLELHAESDGSTLLRIEPSRGSLAGLYNSRYFEQVSDVIPSLWGVVTLPGGGVLLGPPKWLSGEFWELMMEREPEAEAEFEAVRDEITAEDPVARSS